MGGEGDANVPMPTMSDNMEGTHSFFLEPNPGFDTSMFADPAAPAAPAGTAAPAAPGRTEVDDDDDDKKPVRNGVKEADDDDRDDD